MTLSATIYSDSGKTRQLADYTSRIHPSAGGGGLKFGSGPHGFAACELPFVPMLLDEAFAVLNWPGLPWVVVSDRLAGVVWEGRLEGRRQLMGGVALTAFGAARALSDVVHTALWSVTSTDEWRPVSNSELSTYAPQKYVHDNNKRIYLTLKKNEIYLNGLTEVCGYRFYIPDDSYLNPVTVSFDYDITLPNNWILRTVTYDDGYASGVGEDAVTANGSQQTGSKALTITAGKEIVVIYIRNDTGSSYTNTAETGAWYAKIANIRIKSTSSATVLASAIASSLVTYVSGINASQLNSSKALLESSADDLKDEVYEDEYPADILDRLALLHGFEWGVWHNQTLHFREKGSQGRTFYVDVTSLELESDIDPLVNSAYAVYQDANGRQLRSAVSNDDNSQERFGIVRRAALAVRTTDSTQAAAHLAAYLADRGGYALRATVQFEAVYDANGGRRELYELRSSDTLVLRNLPANAGPVIDNIRSFRLARVDYTAAPEGVSVEPDVPTPTLVTLIARQEKGLRT